MKTKLILLAVLTAALAVSAGLITARGAATTNAVATGHKILYYTCPMHPSVKADKAGDCPICGMKLQPVYDNAGGTNAPAAAVSTNKPALAPAGCCSMGGGGCGN